MIAEAIITGAAEGVASVVVKSLMEKWVARYRKSSRKPDQVESNLAEIASGLEAYLERSYQRCRFFKTLLNTNQPLEVDKKYVSVFFEYNRKKISDYSIIKNSESYSSFVITGLAGSGKSMFMKYLTLQKFNKGNGVIPLFIELRHLNALTNRNLLTFIKTSCLSPGHDISDTQFRATLNVGDFILILDGFDEINHEFRDIISKEILDIRNLFPNITIVVSSRPDDRFGSWTAFHVFKVLDLEKDQCLSLIQSLEYDSGIKNRFHRKVKEGLYESHNSFLSSPLLTTIMLLTFQEFAEIPLKMHLFYAQAFDTLFQKHDALKEQYQRKNLTGLEREEFKNCFAFFCAATYLKHEISFDDNTLKARANLVVEYAKSSLSINAPTLNVENFISDLKEAVCMLHQDGIEWCFVHRSFQEYFSAVFAIRQEGAKLRKFLDRYATHHSDSTVVMAREIHRDLVEKEWVLPTVDDIESGLSLSDTKITNADRYLKIFPEIVIHVISKKVYFAYMHSTPEYYSRIYVLQKLYSNVFRTKLSDFVIAVAELSDLQTAWLLPQNRRKARYTVLEKVLTDESPTVSVTIKLKNSDYWWLRQFGIDQYFDHLACSLPEIKAQVKRRQETNEKIITDLL